MIASILKLNRNDCKNIQLKDVYSLHKAVYSLFPKQKEEDTRDFLFADKGGDFNHRKILILSERKPAVPEYGEIISKVVPESFLECDYYGFEIILNPVTKNGLTKNTMPVKGTENLKDWFIKKTPNLGFIVEPAGLQVCRISVLSFEREKEGKTIRQTHGSATFIGKLTVVDRPIFKESFKHGIGRAKGFGFGLLQLVPLKKDN